MSNPTQAAQRAAEKIIDKLYPNEMDKRIILKNGNYGLAAIIDAEFAEVIKIIESRPYVKDASVAYMNWVGDLESALAKLDGGKCED